jgi:hypothetical protein
VDTNPTSAEDTAKESSDLPGPNSEDEKVLAKERVTGAEDEEEEVERNEEQGNENENEEDEPV